MAHVTEHRRIYAFLAAFLVAAVLFISGLFIITHAKHDCTGDNCPVCAEMRTCVIVIHVLSEALGAGSVVIFAYFMALKPFISFMTGLCLRPVSLVSLKIRLND